MDLIVKNCKYYYASYWNDVGDIRATHSALLDGGPWQMLSFVGAYLYFVKRFGPNMMKNRKPLNNLMWPIRMYNLFMVCFNTFLFMKLSPIMKLGVAGWGCGNAMKPFDDEIFKVLELVLLSRYFDFFDSIFFVLRKKYEHLNLLHVCHHSSVPIIFWFAVKYSPQPIVIFAGYINLPVHMIMYSYYCLSTFESMRKYLWWKKYITTVQIGQFVIDIIHSLHPVYLPQCNYPTMTYVQIGFSIFFLYLFCSFFSRRYKGDDKTKRQITTTTETERQLGTCKSIIKDTAQATYRQPNDLSCHIEANVDIKTVSGDSTIRIRSSKED